METNAINASQPNNFFLTVKKDLIDNRKQLLLRLSTLWGVFIVIGGVWGYNHSPKGPEEIFVVGFLALLFGAVIGSAMFANMQTKTGRISTLMLPASTVDKFLVRWIAVVPLAFIAIIAAYYFMEFSRVIVALIHEGTIDSDYATPGNIFTMLTLGGMPGGKKFAFICLCSYFANQAFFILGSVLWPRHSFAKTFAAIWILQMLIGLIFVPFKNFVFNITMTGDQIVFLIGSAQIVLTLVLYYLAYLRLRNSQVVYKLF